MPRVMINGFTLNTPIARPLMAPTASPTASAIVNATNAPRSLSLAATYAARFAVIATERSIPPVSMHSVWLAAKIASGQARRSTDRMPDAVSRLSSFHTVIA